MRRLQEGTDQDRVVSYEPKTVANRACVFCGSVFAGLYLIICINCRSCQYCGLRVEAGDKCHFCGNHPDKDTARPKPRRIRAGLDQATQSPQKGIKTKKRAIRRSGPQSRRGAL